MVHVIECLLFNGQSKQVFSTHFLEAIFRQVCVHSVHSRDWFVSSNRDSLPLVWFPNWNKILKFNNPPTTYPNAPETPRFMWNLSQYSPDVKDSTLSVSRFWNGQPYQPTFEKLGLQSAQTPLMHRSVIEWFPPVVSTARAIPWHYWKIKRNSILKICDVVIAKPE